MVNTHSPIAEVASLLVALIVNFSEGFAVLFWLNVNSLRHIPCSIK